MRPGFQVSWGSAVGDPGPPVPVTSRLPVSGRGGAVCSQAGVRPASRDPGLAWGLWACGGGGAGEERKPDGTTSGEHGALLALFPLFLFFPWSGKLLDSTGNLIAPDFPKSG